MRPEDVGLAGTSLPLGKHSGRAALRAKLKDLGFDMVDNQLNDLFVRFKALADRKKEVFDDDLIALVTDAAAADQDDHLELKFLRVICGTEAPQSADITLRVGAEDKQATAQGDGPVDAAFNAVKALYPNEAVLQLYQVSAVTEGMDAQATVSVRIEEDGRIATGQSADTDTVVASVKAYVNALNRLIVRKEKLGSDLQGSQLQGRQLRDRSDGFRHKRGAVFGRKGPPLMRPGAGVPRARAIGPALAEARCRPSPRWRAPMAMVACQRRGRAAASGRTRSPPQTEGRTRPDCRPRSWYGSPRTGSSPSCAIVTRKTRQRARAHHCRKTPQPGPGAPITGRGSEDRDNRCRVDKDGQDLQQGHGRAPGVGLS
jgi:hypothetical protein